MKEITQISKVLSQREIKREVEDRILSDSKKFVGFSLKNIIFVLVDIDRWGDIPMYKVDGYIKVRIKTGVFRTKPGKKGFSAKVDARNGKILVFNWQEGGIV